VFVQEVVPELSDLVLKLDDEVVFEPTFLTGPTRKRHA